MEENMEMTKKYYTFREYHRRKRNCWPEQHQLPYLCHMNFYWINNLVVALICSLLLLNSCVAAETTQVCVFTNINVILFSFLHLYIYYKFIMIIL